MNDKEFNVSLKNTAELKRLIVENPELPLLIFHCSDDLEEGDYMQMGRVTGYKIDEVTLYKNAYINKDDYREEIEEILLVNDKSVIEMTIKEWDELVNNELSKKKFIKAIVVYIR